MDATARAHAREYETIYILRADTSPDDADKAQGRVTEVIDRLGGKMMKIDQWGRRKLAYKVERQKKGIFVVLKYVGGSDLVAEIERNLRLTDVVIKHQTVLLASDIDMASLTVDDAAVEWKRLELVPEEPDEPPPPPPDEPLEEGDIDLSTAAGVVAAPAPAPAAADAVADAGASEPAKPAEPAEKEEK